MTKFRFLALLSVLVLALVVPATVLAQQQPRNPHRFGGTATLDGKAVAAGTAVTAWIDGKTVATATTGANGFYSIDVIQPEGASYAGKTVSFNIGTAKATQTGIWSEGGVTYPLNLTAVSGPPPTPTPTPAPIVGPKGDKGAAGAKGDTGPRGPAGEAGKVGAAGAKGDAGAAGAAGSAGAAGAKGDTGPAGAGGPKGSGSPVLGIIAIILGAVAIVGAGWVFMKGRPTTTTTT